MQRKASSHGIHRFLGGGALAAALAFTGPALAEGNQTSGDGSKHSETSKSHQQERASGVSDLSRDQIKDLQRELAARGLYQGSIDGIAGQKTESALRNFQTQQGLTVGALDSKTRDALGLDWNQNSGSGERRAMTGTSAGTAQKQPVRGTDDTGSAERRSAGGGEAPSSAQASGTGTELSSLGTERIKAMQETLHREGLYQGEIDGVAGAQTRAALKRYFQRQMQLIDQGRMSDSAVGWFEAK